MVATHNALAIATIETLLLPAATRTEPLWQAVAEAVRRWLDGRQVPAAEAGRDAQAAVDLAEAYRLAGFEEVAWLSEPEAAARACGVSRWWVVVAGCVTSDLESPRLFEMSTSRMPSRTAKAASRALRPGTGASSKVTTLPPPLICRRASSCWG